MQIKEGYNIYTYFGNTAWLCYTGRVFSSLISLEIWLIIIIIINSCFFFDNTHIKCSWVLTLKCYAVIYCMEKLRRSQQKSYKHDNTQ